MKATRLFLAAMVLGTTVAVSQANAQCSNNAGSCSTTNTASVAVGALVKLGMPTTTTTLSSPTADQVDAGAVIADNGPTFTIKANRTWTLKIKSFNPANFDYTGLNSGVKPISHLAWAAASNGTFVAITSSDATFATGSASNGTAAAAFFKTTWVADFADASNREGTYSLPIVFTLTAP